MTNEDANARDVEPVTSEPEVEEVDEGLELDDDTIDPQVMSEIVTYTLDWSVQSLLERIGKTFDIDPAFQRRDAWTVEKKSLYIESLMLGLPVPQIVLAEDKETRGRFIVLDGKQRLLTMKQFATPDENYKSFKLKKLAFLGEVAGGMSFADMQASLSASEYADGLLAQPVRTVVVRNWPTPAILFSIFVRLNQGSVSLSPQELRQALFPNEFTLWVNQRSRNSEPIHRARGIKGEDFRMRDAEMLLRFVAFSENLEGYAGNLRQFLDDACDLKKNGWQANGRAHFDRAALQCELAIDRTFDVFGPRAFRRYEQYGYNRRFNIAVFDLMTAIFADVKLTDEVVEARADEIRAGFESLCISDPAFQASLQVSTKTIGAVGGRIKAFGEVVSRVTGVTLEVVERAEALLSGR